MLKLKNKMHELFCIEYVKSLNATQSAISAGYSKKTARSKGSQLLTKVNIQDRIRELSQPEYNQRIASAEEVLEFLTGVFSGRVKSTYVTPDGDEVEIDAPMRDRVRAAELLGKRHALFTEKIEHSGRIAGDNKLEAILEQLKEKEK